MANYNNGPFVGRAIESILQQDAPDWELLVLDDGSTDDSIAKIEPFLEDSRVRLLRHDENRGYIATLRRLVDEATCDCVALLDSDDALRADAVETISRVFESNPECGFAYSRFQLCDRELRPIESNFNAEPIRKGQSNLHVDKIFAVRAFRRSIYALTTGFGEDYLYAEDKDISFRLEERCRPHFIDEKLYLWRTVDFSQSRDDRKGKIGRASFKIAKADAYLRRRGTAMPNLTRATVVRELLGSLMSILVLREWTTAAKLVVRLRDVILPAGRRSPESDCAPESPSRL
jgi:glycosyltransferase involved in cell wall biosynthesis